MTRAERTYPVGATDVVSARHFARSLLEQWDVKDLRAADSVALVVTELAANAVRHTEGDEFTVAISLEPPIVVVEVRDSNAEEPHVAQPGATDTSGRGLLIVDRLAARWGCRPAGDGGKTVWAEIPVE